MQIRDIALRPPVTISPFHSTDEAIHLMWKHDIRHLLVIDREGLAGLVNDGDLLESVGMLTLAERRAIGASVCTEEIIIADIMDAEAPCVGLGTLVTDAVHRMVYERRTALPVVDAGGLCGVVTDSDAVQLFTGMSWLDQNTPHQEPVIHFGSHVLATVEPDDTLETACIKLSGHEHRHLPVAAYGRFIGLLSDWDIRAAIGQCPPGEWIKLPVAKFMATGVRTIRPEMTLLQVARLMWQDKLAALPITTNSGELRGLVTVPDLLRAFVGRALVHA